MSLPISRRGGSPVSVRRNDASSQSGAMGRIEPWNDLDMMSRLFDNFFPTAFSAFGRGGNGAAQPSEPTVELYETGDDLLAFVYAPGLVHDSFDITASGDVLTIRGERKPLLDVTEGLVSHTPWGGLATGGGTFSASYNLPLEINPASVEAAYTDGVLRIRMPKSEAAKPKQVKVQLNKA